MAKIIRFPVERVRRHHVFQPPVLSFSWWPLAMSSYLWRCSTDALLGYWSIMGGTGGYRGRSAHRLRAPLHRR